MIILVPRAGKYAYLALPGGTASRARTGVASAGIHDAVRADRQVVGSSAKPQDFDNWSAPSSIRYVQGGGTSRPRRTGAGAAPPRGFVKVLRTAALEQDSFH